MTRRCWMAIVGLAGVACLPAPTAHAQPDDSGPTVLTIHPADEPRPALKYAILPPRQDLEPGNAANYYHRAIHMMKDHRLAMLSRPREGGQAGTVPTDDKIYDWITGPLDKIPIEEARERLGAYQSALREVELGARRTLCDWDLAGRPETIQLLLPEIQETRSLARIVALKARLELIDGNIDGAIHWLQTGYALGRHAAEGPTLIQALVGMAITGTMSQLLEDLVQAPGAPNLYWALASRPHPQIDIATALDGEKFVLERMIPGLRDLDSPPWSVERGRQFADELQEGLSALGANGIMPPGGAAGTPSLAQFAPRLGIAALIAKVYPDAKQSLIDAGRSEVEVDAMPAIQVVGLHAHRQFQELRDDVYKWTSLPYWQSFQRIDEVSQSWTVEDKLANPGITMFMLIMPALNSVRVAQVRTDRQLDALQVIEAIRLYAAEHDGAFPPNLDGLTVPAPLDPATRMPFTYTIDGDTATLSTSLIPGFTSDHPAFRVRYELRMAK